VNGVKYLISTRGESQWVKNIQYGWASSTTSRDCELLMAQGRYLQQALTGMLISGLLFAGFVSVVFVLILVER
jgi:hypothetical protein